MFVVDTNVLVYAADAESPFHRPCRELLETSRSAPTAWFLTWGIAYEFLRVVTHHRVFRKPWTLPEAWEFVEALLQSPSVGFLVAMERHAEVAAEVFRQNRALMGNILHDAQTYVLMKEHGIHRIYTRDTDFHRFPDIEPLDPLSHGRTP